MEDIYEKLNKVKSNKKLLDSDKELIKGWEEMLVQISKDVSYLQLEQTQKVVGKIKESIAAINAALEEIDMVDPSELHKLNTMLARRMVYRQILRVYGDKEWFETAAKSIEEEVSGLVEKLDETFSYPVEPV